MVWNLQSGVRGIHNRISRRSVPVDWNATASVSRIVAVHRHDRWRVWRRLYYCRVRSSAALADRAGWFSWQTFRAHRNGVVDLARDFACPFWGREHQQRPDLAASVFPGTSFCVAMCERPKLKQAEACNQYEPETQASGW